jgi:transposase
MCDSLSLLVRRLAVMARPLSLDLRIRVAAALTDGLSVRATAARFGISAATAVRIGQLSRSGKGLMPAKMGGHVKPTLRGAAAEAVHQRLAVKSDWTVRALAADLKAAGIDVSHDTVWRFLRGEGKTFKKNIDGERAGQTEGCAVPGALEDAPASP